MDFLSHEGSSFPESIDDLSVEERRELYRRHFWPVWPSIAPANLKNKKPILIERRMAGLYTASSAYMGEYWVGNSQGSVPIAYCDGQRIYSYVYRGELGYLDEDQVFHPRGEVLEILGVSEGDECPNWPEEVFAIPEEYLRVLFRVELAERELGS